MTTPASYKMDIDGIVFEELSRDVGQYIHNATEILSSNHLMVHIDQASDLLYPKTKVEDAKHKKASFVGGGVIALSVFATSDLGIDIIDHTRKKLQRKPPSSFLRSGSRDTINVMFTSLAHQGKLNHPEIETHLNLLMRYYTAIYQTIDYGMFAAIGLGYTITQLDNLVAHNDNSMSDEIRTGQIDWDRAFRDMQ